MNTSSKTYKNWPMRLALILLVATLFSCYLAGGLSAKFIISDKANDAARAAKFSFNLSNGTNSAIVDLRDIKKPGDTKDFTFTVASGSEVSMRYWITLTLNGSMPLKCEVKKGTETPAVITTTVAQLNTAVSAATPLRASNFSNPVTMTPNPANPDSYTLTVTWPTSEAGVAYDGIEYANNSVAELRIEVVGEQTQLSS